MFEHFYIVAFPSTGAIFIQVGPGRRPRAPVAVTDTNTFKHCQLDVRKWAVKLF